MLLSTYQLLRWRSTANYKNLCMAVLFILVLYIEVYAVILATLYCRASLVQLLQQIS